MPAIESIAKGIESKLDKNARITVEGYQRFSIFLDENVFNDLPETVEVILEHAYTTLTYLHMCYTIKDNNTSNLLSFHVLGYLNISNDNIHQDYLKSDFAILNPESNKILFGVRVFEGDIEKFNYIFKQVVLPHYQQY